MNKWKEASSLIISTACKAQTSQAKTLPKLSEFEKCNFKILSLKKMGYGSAKKPRICVFPGGHLSPADSVQEWETLFSSFGLNLNVLSSLLASESVPKLPIFDKKNGDSIPRWLSLRITAIRETFEECGILLCKSTSRPNQSLSNHLHIDEVELWRVRVLNDPFQFLLLCKQCKCYPDVQNLSLWSNWLTPSYVPDRFDAVFFLTCIDSSALLRGSPDYKEIASTQWHKPEELLALSEQNEIFLKPPQLYEINRLLKIGDFDKLYRFIQPKSGAMYCERWMPVHISASDGVIFLLPGDEMYPKEVNLFEPSPIYRDKESMTSLRCEKMHRMEYSGVGTKLLDTRTVSISSKSKF